MRGAGPSYAWICKARAGQRACGVAAARRRGARSDAERDASAAQPGASAATLRSGAAAATRAARGAAALLRAAARGASAARRANSASQHPTVTSPQAAARAAAPAAPRTCCAAIAVCIAAAARAWCAFAGTQAPDKRPPPPLCSQRCARSMSVRHISGLWRGEAAPAPALADSVPANPILWSLTLLHPAAVSCFGCGYFDDAGDVPGEAILFYMLRGEWAPDTGALSLLKSYTSANLLGVAPHVRYEGRLVRRTRACCARRCEHSALWRCVALRALSQLTRGTATSFCWAPLRRRGWRTARGASRARGATRRRARTACSPAARRRSSRSRSLLATLLARPPRPRRRPAERALRLLLRARAGPLAGRAMGAQQRRAGAILETYAAAQAHRRRACLPRPCSARAASAASCASTRGRRGYGGSALAGRCRPSVQVTTK